MKKTLAITCMIIASIITACSSYDSLENNSIWIDDPDDYCLPKYSEWGYNTFGAQMGRIYFISSWRDNPCTMEWHADDSTLELTMNGCQIFKDELMETGYIRYRDEMSLTIIFPCDSAINCCKKLYRLNGKTFDLTDPAIKVLVKNKDNAPELVSDIRSGELYFKRVQMLYVDDIFEEAIVSGTFDIRYVKNGEKCWLTNGRFDLGITPNLFW